MTFTKYSLNKKYYWLLQIYIFVIVNPIWLDAEIVIFISSY